MVLSLLGVDYSVVSLRDLYMCWGHCSILSILMTLQIAKIANPNPNKVYAKIANLDDCYQLQSDLDHLDT